MEWPADPEGEPILRRYRFLRWWTRQMSQVWFREFSVIGHDLVPRERGVLHVAWHAGAMIDPLVMFSGLPGRLTFVAKHTLWRVPVLRWMLDAAGAQPVQRAGEGEGNRAAGIEALIETMATLLAEGRHCVIYPEGKAHLSPRPVKIKTGPARILQRAIQIADERGLPHPSLQPIGLHYTDQHRFRERALMEIHRPIELPPPGDDDRGWVEQVTAIIDVELNRSTIGMETWEDRHLMWRTRGLVHQARRAQAGLETDRQSYVESITAARRVRAAYQWLQEEDSTRAESIRSEVALHHERMEAYDLSDFEIFRQQNRPTRLQLVGAYLNLSWCWFWMLGFVGWISMIGNFVPYRVAGMLSNRLSMGDKTSLGSTKLMLSIVLMPIWWLSIAMPAAWTVSSIVNAIDVPPYGLLLPFALMLVQAIPWWLLGLMLMLAFPLAARKHIQLYLRTVQSWRTVRRWFRLRDDGVPWAELREKQMALAQLLLEVGDSLILPGDAEWSDPSTGLEDWQVVRRRTPVAP
ncbi:MAG TPA: hypothetical protein EYQ80_06700 [Candidatus Poseidoniales archaeon]|nr:hypothetical protein [Candidatus Poseidoniales archaeon]